MTRHRVWLGSTGAFIFDPDATLPGDPVETQRGLRVQDYGADGETPGDDTVVQPGAPAADNEVLRLGDMAALILGLSRKAYSIYMPNQVIVTPVGQDYIIYPGGESGNTLTAVNISLAAEQLQGSSGTTDIRICDTAKGGSTANSILIQLGYAAKNKNQAGSFTFLVDAPVYIYCEDATGGHVGLSINATIKGY